MEVKGKMSKKFKDMKKEELIGEVKALRIGILALTILCIIVLILP